MLRKLYDKYGARMFVVMLGFWFSTYWGFGMLVISRVTSLEKPFLQAELAPIKIYQQQLKRV